MAKAKKLPSGSWRAQVYAGTVNGKRQYKSFTAATKREAEFAAAEFAAGRAAESHGKMTVAQAVSSYIDSRTKVLSPATIKGYKSVAEHDFSLIDNIPLDDLTQAQVQAWANDFAINHSPKTQRNAHSLLTAALKQHHVNIFLNTRLSQQVKFSAALPSDDHVVQLLSLCKELEPELYKAILLAAFGGFRRSEICAFTADDIHGRSISVNKALVRNADMEYVIKPPKSAAGYRETEVPQAVIDAMPKSGALVNLLPHAVTQHFHKMAKRVGFTGRFHDLRHYYASFLHALGVPDQNIMELGGWHDVNTLRRSYQHAQSDKTKEAVSLINAKFDKMQHKMQHEK